MSSIKDTIKESVIKESIKESNLIPTPKVVEGKTSKRKYPTSNLFDAFNATHKDIFGGDKYEPFNWGSNDNARKQNFKHLKDLAIDLETARALKKKIEKSEVTDKEIVEALVKLMTMAKETKDQYLISSISPLGLKQNFNKIKQKWILVNRKSNATSIKMKDSPQSKYDELGRLKKSA